MHPIHAAALQLAELDIPVFPCFHHPDKSPACPKGKDSRTTDRDQIATWFSTGAYSIGVVPADAGLIAIDPDVGHDPADLDGLPPTYTNSTPSGGRHMLYECGAAFGNGGWAKHIDVRSANGYILVPPSPGYTTVDTREPAVFPSWAAERLLSKGQQKLEISNVEFLDLPVNLDRAERFLDAEIARCGNFGQFDPPDTYALLCAVKDLGVGPDAMLAMMLARHPGEEEWLKFTINNVFSYSQNAPGAHGSPKAEEAFAAVAGLTPVPDEPARRSRYEGNEPDDDENLPELTYWDEARMLPRVPGGSIGILYGPSGSLKSAVVLAMVIDACLDKGAVARFVAGEGNFGMRKQRVPAQMRARGRPVSDLRGKYRTVVNMPHFLDPTQIHEFVEAVRPFKPDIVVFDTMATGFAGTDPNTAIAAAALTDNGTLGYVKNELECLVLLIGHTGKDQDRGIAGNQGFYNNADFVLRCRAERAEGRLTLTCEKMRDGPDGHQAHFDWNTSASGAPTPARCAAPLARQDADDTADMVMAARIYSILKHREATTFAAGLEDRVLAQELCGINATATVVNMMAKKLSNLKHNKKARHPLITQMARCEAVTPDARTNSWRWVLPRSDESL